MVDLDAVQARLDAAGMDVLIVPSGAGVQLIVGPGGRKGITLGSVRLDLKTDQPLIDLWNHAHADLAALVAELRAARDVVEAAWSVERKDPGCYGRMYRALHAHKELTGEANS